MTEIIIFGAGQRGRRYFHILQEQQITVDYFCDNDERIQGEMIEGIRVISPLILKQKHPRADVLLANRFYAREIRKQLDEMGICYTEEIEEFVFRTTRLNVPVVENYGSSAEHRVLPQISVLVVGAHMDDQIDETTSGSIAAWDLIEDYEIVVWKGRDTRLSGRKVLVLTNGSAVSSESVHELIDTERQMGAVIGSKSVIADGSIVQAGYVIQNGNVIVSYGCGKRASEPEYEYVRECDAVACNGTFLDVVYADIFLKCLENYKSLEEAAVAFSMAMREQHVKIIFQPFCLIIEKQKLEPECYIRNPGLAAKCVRYLKYHSAPTEELFWQANRGNCFCRTLIADTSVAKYDTNAGNLSTYNYIQVFQELGMWMIYIPDNFEYACRYVMHFQKMGIFVVYGRRWRENWKILLKKLLPQIAYAFLNRPETAVKYVEMLRKNSDAIIVHYGHDLHYLRLEREYGITGDEKLLEEAAHYKKLEYDLISKVDVTGYPSIAEVNLMKKIFPEACIELFPLYFYKNVRKEMVQENRAGILFVGGFSHRPNVDAAVWLVEEILPQLRRSGIKDTVYLAGSNPTETVWELQRQDVVVTGYVTEQELQAYYDQCFAVVIPLRFGAGMKGKVLEAMYAGIPVVTTDIGAEGLVEVEKVIGIGNTVEQIVSKIVFLYENRGRLQEIMEEERRYIISRFTKDVILQIVQRHVESKVQFKEVKRL